jgi:hypothetical protein
MPKFLEKKLKKQYGAKSDIPYKIMNKLGYMRGSKETVKGKKAEKKHERQISSKGTLRSHSKIRGLGGEVRRPATRSHHQGKSFAENLTGARYK